MKLEIQQVCMSAIINGIEYVLRNTRKETLFLELQFIQDTGVIWELLAKLF